MEVSDIELLGRTVLVVGHTGEARHTIARCRAAGARVRLAPRSTESSGERSGRNVSGAQARDQEAHNRWATLIADVDLVIVVGADADHGMLGAACSEARVLLCREPASPVSLIGQVTLVGGGPGDPGLMTTASIAALRAADVVLYDRLVPSERLAELAPGAELIDVGKTPGHHAVPQSGIHSLLVEHALHGRSVVRLKGGDPFVFGRGGEEVAACREAGVPVRVLSGVTSAIAVPAAAGIPVTHRDVSRMFTVVSGHVPLDDVELSHLVGLASTIVVLMGVGTLPHLAAGLRRHGLSDAVPVAIVERGFSSSQRTTITTLGEIVGIASRVRVRSPAVLVIGEVVRWAASADVAAVELIDSAAVLLAEE
ncbi:MAG: uroporphyrinogen-III C-methyltransferase [Actinomycetota bacterium]